MNKVLREKISIEQATYYLKSNSHIVDLDTSLDRSIAEYYFVNNIGYLITYELLNEAILFQSKEEFFVYCNDERDFVFDIEKSILSSENNIKVLNQSLNVKLSNQDKIEKLKEIDLWYNNLKGEKTDIILILDELFSYFYITISNSLENYDWQIVINNDNDYSCLLFDNKGNQYEIYKPFHKMLINQDELFSFFSLASQIVNPLRFEIRK